MKGVFSRVPLVSARQLDLVPGRPDCAVEIEIAGRLVTIIVAHPRPPRIGRSGVTFDRR